MGLSMIAAQGQIHMHAQSGRMEIVAKGSIDVISANTHINWAAGTQQRWSCTTRSKAQAVATPRESRGPNNRQTLRYRSAN
jgi:Uncharacterized protein conserved in bacteria (DUF2345)